MTVFSNRTLRISPQDRGSMYELKVMRRQPLDCSSISAEHQPLDQWSQICRTMPAGSQSLCPLIQTGHRQSRNRGRGRRISEFRYTVCPPADVLPFVWQRPCASFMGSWADVTHYCSSAMVHGRCSAMQLVASPICYIAC